MLQGQNDRMTRYRNILSMISPEVENNASGDAPGAVDWLLDEDDTLELQGKAPSIKDEAGGPLVGTFADITAART